jgi:hypothetical protein
MATYQVGYFVGSLSSKSINRILSKALIPLSAARSGVYRDTDRRSAALQP